MAFMHGWLVLPSNRPCLVLGHCFEYDFSYERFSLVALNEPLLLMEQPMTSSKGN
jgi:hypothetical protein